MDYTISDAELDTITGKDIFIGEGNVQLGDITIDAITYPDSPEDTNLYFQTLGTVTVDVNGITNLDHTITFVGGDVDINGPVSTNGLHDVRLFHIDPTQDMYIGDMAGAGYRITNADLNNITDPGAIWIGADHVQSGNITIDRVIYNVANKNISITTQGTITLDDGGAQIALSNNGGAINIYADGGIVLAQANNNADLSTSGQITLTTTGANGIGSGINDRIYFPDGQDEIIINTQTGDVYLGCGGSISLGAVTTQGGNLYVSADNDITIAGPIVTNGGEINLFADQELPPDYVGSIIVNNTLNAGAGNIVFQSAGITIAANITTTGNINFYTTDGSKTMGIGGAAGDYQISDAELAFIQNADKITFGNDAAVDITQTGNITFQTTTSPVSDADIIVYTTGEVHLEGIPNVDPAAIIAALTTGTNANITITANEGIFTDNPHDEDGPGGPILAKTLAGGQINLITTTGDIGEETKRISFPADQKNVAVTSTSGNIYLFGLGDLTTGAITTDDADVSLLIRGDLTISGDITSDGGHITLDATDVTINNDINAGNDGCVQFQTQLNIDPNIEMGIGSAVSDYTIDNAELAHIVNAGEVTFGNDIAEDKPVNIYIKTVTWPAQLADANIELITAGAVNLDDNNTGIALATGGSGSIMINAPSGITATNGDNNLAELSTTGGIEITTTTGAVGTSANRIQFVANQDEIKIKTTNADVFIDGLGDITIGLAKGGPPSGIETGSGNINITSSGSILDRDSSIDYFVTTGTLTLTSVDGIGTAANHLNTTVGTIDATGPDGIYIDNTGDVIVGGTNGLTATNGAVDLDAASDITVNTAVSGQSVDLSATENITINANITATAGNLTLTADSDADNTGAITVNGADLSTTGGTAIITIAASGASSLEDITSAEDLILNRSGATVTYTINSTIQVAGSVTISNGVTVNAGTSNWTMGGDWSNSGTFNGQTSTVTFNNAAKVTTITGDSNFYNFTCATAGKQINFQASSTQTIKGTFTLTGQSGNLIVLRSTASGTQSKIDPQGTRNVSYVDVKDSYNINDTIIDPSDSVDSGNNTNWFPSPESDETPQPPEPEPEPKPKPKPKPKPEEDNIAIGPSPVNSDYQDECCVERYGRCYYPGTYRTNVIVFEGRVIVAPYDKKGPKYEEGILLVAGEKISVEAWVKEEKEQEEEKKLRLEDKGFDLSRIEEVKKSKYETKIYGSRKYKVKISVPRQAKGEFFVYPYQEGKIRHEKGIILKPGQTYIKEVEIKK